MYNILLFIKSLLQESVSAVSEVIDVVTSEDVTAAVEAVQSGFYADMGMMWMVYTLIAKMSNTNQQCCGCA